MPVILALVVVLAAALQGTFGPVVYPVAAAVLFLLAAFCRQKEGFRLPTLLFALLAVWSVVSSVVCGFSAESLATAMLPAAVFAVVLLTGSFDAFERMSAAVTVCALSAVMAFVGLVAFVGFDPLAWRLGHHLVFGFADADVAAIWFAAVFFINQRLVGYNRFLALALPLNAAALLLTCSALVVPIALIAELVIVVIHRSDAFQMSQVVSAFVAVVLAVALYFAQGVYLLPIALVALLLGWSWFAEEAGRYLAEHKAHYVCTGIAAVAAIVGCAFSLRLQQELPNQLHSAFTQMADGIACIASNPVLGIGACQWNYLSVFYQSSPVSSTNIPNSFIHLGAEGGAVALLLVAALIVLAVMRLLRGGAHATAAAAVVVIGALLTPCLAANFAVPALVAVLAAAAPALEEITHPAAEDDDAPSVRSEEGACEPAGLLLPRPALIAITCILCAASAVPAVFQCQQIAFRSSWVSGEVDSVDVVEDFAAQPYWVQNSPGARMIYDQYLISEVTASSNIYQAYIAGQDALGIFDTTTQTNLYDAAAQAYIHGWRFEFDEGFQILFDAARRAPQAASVYATMQTYLDYTNVSADLAQQAVSLAQENGYSLEPPALSDDEKDMYASAAEDYATNFEGLSEDDIRTAAKDLEAYYEVANTENADDGGESTSFPDK